MMRNRLQICSLLITELRIRTQDKVQYYCDVFNYHIPLNLVSVHIVFFMLFLYGRNLKFQSILELHKKIQIC